MWEVFKLFWNIFALAFMIISLPAAIVLGTVFDITIKDACKFPKEPDG